MKNANLIFLDPIGLVRPIKTKKVLRLLYFFLSFGVGKREKEKKTVK